MSPAAAATVMLLTAGAFLAANVVRPLRSPARVAGRLGLRGFGTYLPLLTAAIGAKLVLMLSGFVLHEEIASRRILPRLPDDSDVVSDAFMAHPFGAAALFLAITVLAPLIEEFAFRGKMQSELEGSLGVAAAIVVPAVAFSALHGVVDAVHHLPYGLFAGWVVWRTGSIWTAVYMHAVNNAVAGGALYLSDPQPGVRDIPSWAWPVAVLAGVTALGALIVIGARIHAAANRRTPRPRVSPSMRSADRRDTATARR